VRVKQLDEPGPNTPTGPTPEAARLLFDLQARGFTVRLERTGAMFIRPWRFSPDEEATLFRLAYSLRAILERGEAVM